MFVALGKREASMLSTTLDAMQIGGTDQIRLRAANSDSIATKPDVAKETRTPVTTEKKRVFVAMPFSDEFQNVYDFGIYPAVRNCGFICERSACRSVSASFLCNSISFFNCPVRYL